MKSGKKRCPLCTRFMHGKKGTHACFSGVHERRPLADRFWEKVEIRTANECWPWLGAKSIGYGDIRVFLDGRWKTVKATRVMWFLINGKWPAMDLLHSCDNPPCVNLAHLSEGTGSDNKQQEIARGRNHNATKTHCLQGHEFSAKNTHLTIHGKRCRACDRIRHARIRQLSKSDNPVVSRKKLEAQK